MTLVLNNNAAALLREYDEQFPRDKIIAKAWHQKEEKEIELNREIAITPEKSSFCGHRRWT